MWVVDRTRAALRGTRHVTRILIVMCVIVLYLISGYHIRDSNRHILSSAHPLLHKPFGNTLTMQLPPKGPERWQLLHETFSKHDPGNPLSTNVNNAGKARKYGKEWDTCKRPETDLVILEEDQLKLAKESHAGLLEELPKLAESFTYEKGSRGIVATTGGDGHTILVVSLKMLRATGCTLPVEVFIAAWHDWEPQLCEKVYPALGATCVYLGMKLLDVDIPENSEVISGYQLKAFAILLSSFEQVLFIDADAFPIVDPNLLFDSEPFKSTGLVTWPDYWCASQAKMWYEITGAQEIPVSERASSESGEILYDKSKHIQDLLLTCYYNYYGPGLWWGLLSQGFPGEGDKETYIAAADVLNATSYQVQQPPIELPEKDAPGQAIPQANPAEEYALRQSGKDWRDGHLASYAFIHNHWPKSRAWHLMHSDYKWLQQGTHARFWGSKEWLVEKLGHDWEHELWKAIEYSACDVGNMFKAWEGKESSCQFVQIHIGLVFEPERPFSAAGRPIRGSSKQQNLPLWR